MTEIELSNASSKPREAFDGLLRDIVGACRDEGTPDALLEGVQIAMKLAYSLGVQAGKNEGWAQ